MSKAKQNSTPSGDLPESNRDRKELKSEEFTIDMPDVEDIPGQEHVHPPKMGEYADTTISSSDEEGDGIWDTDDVKDDDSNVSVVEKQLLSTSATDQPTKDEEALRRASLDNRDDDGDLLNEKTSANSISGSDLDVPGADEDDLDEEIGEEDEENNSYSLGGDDHSENEERSGT